MSNTKERANGREEKIRAPQQARSREAMDRIMVALERLLEEKSFDNITMQELAQRSDTGTSSIYARFKDKHALILGVHDRVRERALSCLDPLTDPAHWEGKSLDRIVTGIIITSIKFYREHGSLIRAVLYVDQDFIRERQGSVLRAAAKNFTALLADRVDSSPRRLDRAVDAACRVFASTMYAELMFGNVPLLRTPVSDRELARQLTRIVMALIESAGERRD